MANIVEQAYGFGKAGKDAEGKAVPVEELKSLATVEVIHAGENEDGGDAEVHAFCLNARSARRYLRGNKLTVKDFDKDSPEDGFTVWTQLSAAELEARAEEASAAEEEDGEEAEVA